RHHGGLCGAKINAPDYPAADAHIERRPVTAGRFDNKDGVRPFDIINVPPVWIRGIFDQRNIPGRNVTGGALDPALTNGKPHPGYVEVADYRRIGIYVNGTDAVRFNVSF